MRLEQFVKRVPWVEMEVNEFGQIRHKYAELPLCPIDCAGGDWRQKGGGLKLSEPLKERIIWAADYRGSSKLRILFETLISEAK